MNSSVAVVALVCKHLQHPGCSLLHIGRLVYGKEHCQKLHNEHSPGMASILCTLPDIDLLSMRGRSDSHRPFDILALVKLKLSDSTSGDLRREERMGTYRMQRGYEQNIRRCLHKGYDRLKNTRGGRFL